MNVTTTTRRCSITAISQAHIDKDPVARLLPPVDTHIVPTGVPCGNLRPIFVGPFGELTPISARCSIVLLWKFGPLCEFVIATLITCFEGCGLVFVFMNKVVGLLQLWKGIGVGIS